MKKFRPLGDRVMYRLVAAEAKTPGGIILSQMEDDRNPLIGIVVSVGPDVKTVAKNDEILIERGVSTKFSEGFNESKQELMFCQERHIIAVDESVMRV